MAHLRDLVEDLRMLVPIAIVGKDSTISGDPAYQKLRELVHSVSDSPELDELSPEELRALSTYRLTVYRAGPMEPTMARKHIGAVWRGAAKQAVLKLSIGGEARKAMQALMAGGIG